MFTVLLLALALSHPSLPHATLAEVCLPGRGVAVIGAPWPCFEAEWPELNPDWVELTVRRYERVILEQWQRT